MVGKKVMHGTYHKVGTVIAEGENIVWIDLGHHTPKPLLTRVAEQNIVTPRDSFNYKPGDREV